MTSRALPAAVVLAALTLPACGDQPPAPRPVRFMLHGNMAHTLPTEEYLRFVEQVRPDILVMGVFDQRLYAAAYPPRDRKPTAEPLVPAEHLARWRQVADRLHRHGIRLIGQMELFVVSDRPADRAEQTGWFGYYERGWDERLLGPRPARSAADLLEEPDLDRHPDRAPARDAVARCGCRVNEKSLHACASKPAWRSVQKAMVKAAIDVGVDGFITNRNYLNHCACSHCTARFRRWLTGRYAPQRLREELGIEDLDRHPLCVVGANREHERAPSALDLERQRCAKHVVKEFFDEVYRESGRARKPDLLLAQWNHMAYFDELHLDRSHLPPSTRTNLAHGLADERWGLPLDLWGRGEDLCWYCNWGTSQNTILAREYAGDTTLYGKLLRSLSAGRPYVINKYDYYRPRNMMAEAAALGYATNALVTHWEHADDRSVTLKYFAFLREHADLYQPAESYAEVGLVFPRRALHAGDASPLEYAEAAGRTLARQHLLFDVLPDDSLAQAPLDRYRVLVMTGGEFLGEAERVALARYVRRGGRLLDLPVKPEDRDRPGAATESARRRAARAPAWDVPVTRVADARTDREAFARAVVAGLGGKEGGSSVEAPWTVQVHAYQQPGRRRLVLHLVNYDHKEKAPGKSVSAREAPVAADPVTVHWQLPDGFRVRSVRFHSPDDGSAAVEGFRQDGRSLRFETPRFLVYGLCVVEG